MGFIKKSTYAILNYKSGYGSQIDRFELDVFFKTNVSIKFYINISNFRHKELETFDIILHGNTYARSISSDGSAFYIMMVGTKISFVDENSYSEKDSCVEFISELYDCFNSTFDKTMVIEKKKIEFGNLEIFVIKNK